jgi:hypothetical protein
MNKAELNFIRQQGFRDASPESCAIGYPALMWQPRAIGILVLAGIALQAWPYFLTLGALLWWNAALPRLNPFDLLYNRIVARPRGLPRLSPAPPPRRFAQAMAGGFMLGIALSLALGARPIAWILEGLLLAALGALIFGRFCLGSYLFHLLMGRAAYANRTLPWAREE